MTLPDWMQASFLGNPLVNWLRVLAWAVGATLTVSIVRAIVARRLAALAAKTDTIADDLIVEVVRSVRKTYVLLIAVGLSLETLDLPSLRWLRTIQQLVALVSVLQGIRSGTALVDFWLVHYAAKKSELDKTTLRALGYGARFIVWVTIIVVGLELAGFRPTSLLTTLGVGGIAIALAIQNILGDLFAALSIVLDKPFVIGDAIAVDAFEGEVAHIGLKSTRVRSINGEEVIFANTDLLKSRLRNLTRRDGRRFVIDLMLSPGATAAQAARVPMIVAEAVKADGRSSLQRSHVKAITTAGVEVESAIVVPGTDWLAAFNAREAVLIGILDGLQREGIPLARSALLLPPGSPAPPA